MPDDEYVVFLAKDNAFAEVVHTYREICARMGADKEQLEAIDRMICRLDFWRHEHSDRCKVPDAKGEILLDIR